MALLPNFSFMRPSCGTRFSAMSSLEMHLDAGGQLFFDGDGWLGDFAQFAVNTEAHAVGVFVGLEVQVGRAGVDGVDQHFLQEANNRGVFHLRVACRATLVGAAAAVLGDVEFEVGRRSGAELLLRCGGLTFQQFGQLVVFNDDPLRVSWVANLMRSMASWSGGVGACDKQAVAPLGQHQ
jgi:hypothetical protein